MRSLLSIIGVGTTLLTSSLWAPSFAADGGQFVSSTIIQHEPPTASKSWGSNVTLKDRFPSLLLTIEYPGGVTPAASAVWREQLRTYEAQVTKDLPARSAYMAKLTDAFLDQKIMDQINKSGYYSLQVFQYLLRSKRFPPNTIALRAVTIDADSRWPGQLKVNREAVSMPSELTIRFLVHRDVNDVSDGTVPVSASTFGNYVTPEAKLITESSAWPASAGVVVSIGGRVLMGGSLIFSCPPQTCMAEAEDFSEMIDRYTPYKGTGVLKQGNDEVDPFINASQLGLHQELPYPRGLAIEETLFEQPSYVVAQEDLPIGDGAGGDWALGRLFLNTCVQALGQIDPYLAMRMQWKAYIGLFDKALSDRWPNTSLTAAENQRLNYIKKIMHAERDVLAKESATFANAETHGPAGTALRHELQAEIAVMEQLHAADQKAFVSNVLNLLAFMNTEVVTRGGGAKLANALAFSQDLANTTAAQSEVLRSIQSEFGFRDESRGLNLGHGTVPFDGEQIAASTIEGFRNNIGERYRKTFPSVETQPEERCKEVIIGNSTLKNWTGVCDPNAKIDPSLAFIKGESYFEAYSKAGAFQEMAEWENGPEQGRKVSVNYSSCFYVVAFPQQPGWRFDRDYCLPNDSPRSVLEAIAGFGGSAGSIYARVLMFSTTDDLSTRLLVWHRRGVDYKYFDRATKKLRPPSATERAQMDKEWLDWKNSRDAIMEY